jgi:hypothetical protein
MTVAEEAQRYLAVVETFRAQGCEPHWRRESSLERAQLSNSPPIVSTQTRKRRKSCSN